MNSSYALLAQVRPEIPGVRLELYGAGDYRPTVERLVAELGLGDVVHFHGQQPIEQLPAAIRAIDVGVVYAPGCVHRRAADEAAGEGEPGASRLPAPRTATTADYFDESMVLLFEPGNARSAASLLAVYRTLRSAQGAHGAGVCCTL